jgi:predicted nucleotidyltransferase
MGRKLIDHTLPDIAHQLERIANQMEKPADDKKVDKIIEFLETVEALTTDPATAGRIRSFFVKEGIWPSPQNN